MDQIIYFDLPGFILLAIIALTAAALAGAALYARRLTSNLQPFGIEPSKIKSSTLNFQPVVDVLEALPWGILVVDESGRPVAMNAEVAGLWGQPLPDRLEEPLATLHKTVQGSREALVRSFISHAGVRLQVRAAPLSSAGRTLFVLEDITGQHRQREFYQHFISNVSHELKTPLTIIQGHINQMGETPQDGAAWQASRRIVAEETTRLTQLVDNLLLLSRLESPDFVLDRQPVNIGAIVEDAILQLSDKAEARNIALSLQRSEGLPRILADRARLKQVFINLLDNAIKYTDDGGAVRVRLSADDKHVVAQVSDTGEGIPPEDLPYIFEKMYRVERPRRRTVEGSGLGLSIVRRIIEQHGGTISVESQVERGTTVTVRLLRQ